MAVNRPSQCHLAGNYVFDGNIRGDFAVFCVFVCILSIASMLIISLFHLLRCADVFPSHIN